MLIQAQERKISGKKVQTLRENGLIPAVIYGHNLKAQNLALDYLTFEKIYQEAGESSLIDLKIDESTPIKVLIQAVQRDPVSHKFIHIDFQQVKMTEKLTAEIQLKFSGEAPAIKELGGVLVRNFDKIEVECLPQDLVHEIEVDVSGLKTFDDAVLIKDLAIPAKIKVLAKGEEMVAKVMPPRKEEEAKPAAEEEGEKKEEVPGEETEAATGEEKEVTSNK